MQEIELKERLTPSLTDGHPSYHHVTEAVSIISEVSAHRNWYIALAITTSITGMMGLMLAYLIATGVGV
ncbi:MAG: hydrogenase, partial [Saprospiraceae bacterium]